MDKIQSVTIGQRIDEVKVGTCQRMFGLCVVRIKRNRWQVGNMPTLEDAYMDRDQAIEAFSGLGKLF